MSEDKTEITTSVQQRERLRESLIERNLVVESAEDLDFGEILLKSNIITEEQLAEAVQIQMDKGFALRLGEVLVQMKAITEAQLLEVLAKQLNIPYVRSIHDREIPEELIKRVPTRFAKKYQVLPIGYKNNAVLVSTSDPLNVAILDDVRMLLESPIIVAATPSAVIMEAINRSYDRASTADSAIEDLGQDVIDDQALQEPVDLLDSEDEAPIIRLVNSLLFRAVK